MDLESIDNHVEITELKLEGSKYDIIFRMQGGVAKTIILARMDTNNSKGNYSKNLS